MSSFKEVAVFLTSISLIIYLITLFGVYQFKPDYITYLETIVKILIGLLLIVRYNPLTYNKEKFTDTDRRICFSAGVLLLINTSIITYFKKQIEYKVQYLFTN